MSLIIDRVDHFVLTVKDIEATCRFYEQVLGMRRVGFEGRVAVAFGQQKINLHPLVNDVDIKARHPIPGSGDFCLVTETPLPEVIRHLEACKITIEKGPVPRAGATGPMRSVYFRDPDDNLVEVSNYA
jgi:catechol 2,3-dioxygenase-like lactoylglutathione lyase family enzyme